MKQRFHVTGMTCSACSSHVEKAVNAMADMDKASVNLLTETMEVEYGGQDSRAEEIIREVEKAGYGASLLERSGAGRPGERQSTGGKDGRDRMEKAARQENQTMKNRLVWSVVFLLPLMYVAMFHMYRDWFGIPVPGFVMAAFHGPANAMNMVLTQFLLVLPILYLNRKFFTVGFKTLAHRSPNMDSLVALGSAAAMGYGIFAMYRIGQGLGRGDLDLVNRYSHDLYFESAGMILTLITVGKYLESRSKGKTSQAIKGLMDLSPKKALILGENGEEIEVDTDSLQVGDVFLVKPGSLIPADGTVLEGQTTINESAITGESLPVEKKEGNRVITASMNQSGFLKCRADKVGEDTTLSQIIRLVEEASASKAPIAQLADKVAGVFVPVVMGIALLTLVIWLVSGASAEFAISSAIAVLVISCPCALGLATPVAIMVGTGVGAGHGILMKSGEAIQRAGEIDTVVLDKTGTITEGRLSVREVWIARPDVKQEDLILMAAALERKSEHPLGAAIVDQAQKLGKVIPETVSFEAVFGRGVRGKLDSGQELFVGNRPFLEEEGILPQGIDIMAMEDTIAQKDVVARADAMAQTGQTPLYVADRDGLLGIIGVADTIKAGSVEAIKAWHGMGVRVIMLTGDNRKTAEAVRDQVGAQEVIAQVLPQDKERKVSQLVEEGCKVAMIGDGINDAPALAAASVGMAIGAGTDVAMESADIILVKSDLRDAVTAMKLSRSVIRNIKENLFWAFFYNCVGIPLAAGVLYPMFGLRLSPMFGAAAMSFSSIFVVGNALRLRRFKSNISMTNTGMTSAGMTNTGMTNTGESNAMNQENIAGMEETSMTKVIKIEGMACGHCSARVQKVLEELNGVASVEVSLENKEARVELNQAVEDSVLEKAVTDAGYQVVK